MAGVPTIDISPLAGGGDPAPVGGALDVACRDVGFFAIVGHGVDPELPALLESAARRFFSASEAVKGEIAMARAGRAWRGWFPVGGELTSGVPDRKEGIYFGSELGTDDPRVRSGTPLHGPNLFPHQPPELRPLVLAYMDEMTRVARAVLAGLALGLGLERSWFDRHLAADPLILFRIFHYPRATTVGRPRWGVGEHTDYGLLTIVGQDDTGGLQVRTPDGWVEADPLPGSLICNIGDMLERLTGGLYRSTPHRVRSPHGAGRLSFAFFFDPSWDAVVDRLPIVARPPGDDAAQRWDHASVHGFTGTYGEYILAKVGKVFPDLASQAIAER